MGPAGVSSGSDLKRGWFSIIFKSLCRISDVSHGPFSTVSSAITNRAHSTESVKSVMVEIEKVKNARSN